MVQWFIKKNREPKGVEPPMPVHELPHIAITSHDFWTFNETARPRGETFTSSPHDSSAAVDNAKTSMPEF